jgi:hypothetical protein
MRSPYIEVFCVSLLCFPCFPGQQPKQTDKEPNQPSIFIRVENGALNASFRDQPLHLVCHMIAEKSDIRIVLADGLVDDLVSLNVSSAALDVSLRELFAGYDMFAFYGGSKGVPSGLRTVWVYPKGGASDLRPVPRSDWAGVRELEATLGDTNAEIREAAYEALLERPDPRSRSLVVDAIRGIRERDSVLRERLLSTAISRGFSLTADVLTDLARADASEQIRWMALDALAFSEYPSAKDVAVAATTDPSEAVRSRAKEMLNQLSGGRREQRVETETEPAGPPGQ